LIVVCCLLERPPNCVHNKPRTTNNDQQTILDSAPIHVLMRAAVPPMDMDVSRLSRTAASPRARSPFKTAIRNSDQNCARARAITADVVFYRTVAGFMGLRTKGVGFAGGCREQVFPIPQAQNRLEKG
jgi:hypothetical protein